VFHTDGLTKIKSIKILIIFAALYSRRCFLNRCKKRNKCRERIRLLHNKKILRFSHFHHVLMLIIPTSIFTIMMLKLDHVSRPGSPIGGKMLSSSMISSDLFEAKLNLKNINLFNKYHLSHGCM